MLIYSSLLLDPCCSAIVPQLANEATRSCAVLTLLGPLVSYTRSATNVTAEATRFANSGAEYLASRMVFECASWRSRVTQFRHPRCVLQPQTACRKGKPPICIKLRPLPSPGPIGP